MMYEDARETMQTGDLLLWRSDTIIGWLIRLKCKGWNHAGLVLRLPDYEMGTDRRYTMEALETGAGLYPLSRRLAEHKGTCWCFPLRPAFHQERQRIGSRALEYSGTGYDFGSLLWNALGKVSADARRLFCSEYVFLSMGCSGKAPRPDEMLELGFWETEGVRLK
jgi:hypothetical protein